MGTGIIVAIALVAANGFFVGAEFAIARLRPTQVAEFVRDRKPGAKSAQHAVTHIDAYLSACQLGITLASLGLGAVGEPAFHDLLEPVFGDGAEVLGIGIATLVAFSIITVAHVVLGELAPKSAAISRTAPVALFLCPPMRAFYLATKPVVDLFNALGNLVLKPFGVPPASEAGHAPHSEEELRTLLRESSEGGLIDSGERRVSDAALVFGDLRAREVMQARPEIDSVSVADSREAMIALAIATGRTRLPLVDPETGLDCAETLVNAKDLLRAEDFDLERLRRPLPKVPEGIQLDELLPQMQRDRHHMALVVDEHGTVTGLITLEDIIEELVGEIDDEFDTDDDDLVWREDGRVVVDGQAPVRIAARELGWTVDAPREATLSGLLIERLGRVPQTGEAIEIDGVALEVVEADSFHVVRVAQVSRSANRE